MEHSSRATEKELDHRGEANISRSDFLMEKRYSRKAIHGLSCDHAGGGRDTDDRLQHNESDQLQGIVVRLEGSACSHSFPADMADHCAGQSLFSQNSLM